MCVLFRILFPQLAAGGCSRCLVKGCSTMDTRHEPCQPELGICPSPYVVATPTLTAGPEVGLVYVQGARIPAERYIPLLRAVQNASALQVPCRPPMPLPPMHTCTGNAACPVFPVPTMGRPISHWSRSVLLPMVRTASGSLTPLSCVVVWGIVYPHLRMG